MVIKLRDRASLSVTVNPAFGGRPSIFFGAEKKTTLYLLFLPLRGGRNRRRALAAENSSTSPSPQGGGAGSRFEAENRHPVRAIHESLYLQTTIANMIGAIKFECRLHQGALRNGGRTPYVSHRQTHSTGPKRNRRSQSGEATSCTNQTTAITPICSARSTNPNQPRP